MFSVNHVVEKLGIGCNNSCVPRSMLKDIGRRVVEGLIKRVVANTSIWTFLDLITTLVNLAMVVLILPHFEEIAWVLRKGCISTFDF